MEAPGATTELAALRGRWLQWTALVEGFAHRRVARLRVDAEGYRKLHRELLRGCRSLAGRAGEPGRAFFEGLEDLVRPWLHPRVLEQADREILFDLLARCQEATRELTGRNPGRRRWVWRALGIGALLLGLVGVAWAVDRFGMGVAARGGEWSHMVSLALRRSIDVPHLAIAGILAIPVAVYLVWHSARA
jgi:hypothetical protein